MQNINVTVGDPTSPIIPTPTPNNTESVSVPNTGTFTDFFDENGSIAIILGLMLFVVIVATCLLAAARKHHSHTRFRLRSKPMIISGLALIFILSAVVSFSYSQNTEKSVNANNSNTLSITIDSTEKTISPNIENGFGYAPSTITVSSNQYGYTLDIYATNGDLINTTSSTTDKIKGLDPASTPTTLSNNTWGIALNQPINPTINENSAIFQYIPTDKNNPLRLKETDASTASDISTTVYYGAKVDSTLEVGTYTDTINYIAVAKPVPTPPCPAGNICYNDNGANSPTTMDNQTINSTDTEATLWASNFQYQDSNLPSNITTRGFAGWNTKADGTGVSYGPNETITDATIINEIKNNGLRLYANWIDSAGYLQSWNGCNAMNIGDITALTDQRDNNTYAVAKLADNKCWMIENLRLDNQYTTGNTNKALAQGYNSSFIGLADPETANFASSTTANSLYSVNGSTTAPAIAGQYQTHRFPRYNNQNTSNPITNMDGMSDNIYSYGNYYTWSAVVADTSNYTISNQSIVTTSICPTSWALPKGGNKNNIINSDFWKLITTTIGIEPANTPSQTYPVYTGDPEGINASSTMRRFPNNFIYSGYFDNNFAGERGSHSYHWSSTIHSGYSSYNLGFYYDRMYPGTVYNNKYYGFSARCVYSI